MIKKRFLTAAASVLALTALAYTEVSEVMTIRLRNGETQEINVDSIAEISFAEKTKVVSFELTPADGSDPIVSESITPLFRLIPQEDGAMTSFAFGGAPVESIDELRAQPYAVCVSLSALSVYTGEIDLTEPAKANMIVYKYADNAVETSWTVVKEGKVSTTRDIRGLVTITLEAEMEDGPSVYATFSGKVTDVDSFDGLDPAPVYHNQVIKFNMDGDIDVNDNILEVKKSVSSLTGRTAFVMTLEKNNYNDCKVEMTESLFGSEVNVPEVESSERGDIYLCYGTIQLYSPNERGAFVPNEATAKVIDHGDGTYTIEADFTNKYTYTDFSGNKQSGGTPERVLIQYTGEVK